MQFTVEDLNTVKKVLHIEIPGERVTKELDKAYNELKKTAKIKGFRPGKAPRSVLERLYKKDVHADITSRLIQESFEEAVKESDLKVVGQPQMDPPELKAKEPFKYDITVEIHPKIEDIDFKGIPLKKTNYRVSEEELEIQLKALQKNNAQLVPVEEDRAALEDDPVLIDYEGFHNGQPYEETQKTTDFTLKIGSVTIAKELDQGLVGMKPGESKEIKVVFPKDHPNKKLASLEINFQVTLKEIRKEVLPALDDEFGKKFGDYATLDDLRNKIRENLEKGYEKRVEHEMNEQIYQALIEKTEFEVPDALIDYELQGILSDAERSFAYQNKSLEDMGLSRESLSEKYRDTAEKQARRHLILSKIVEQENLTLSDEDMDEGFRNMAEDWNQPFEQLKRYFTQDKSKLRFFKETLLEKSAIRLIFENSSIQEVEPEPEKPAQESVEAG